MLATTITYVLINIHKIMEIDERTAISYVLFASGRSALTMLQYLSFSFVFQTSNISFILFFIIFNN